MARMTVYVVVLTCVNIFCLIIGAGVLIMRNYASCYSIFYGPLSYLAGCLAVLSVVGLMGICCRSPFLMWLYLLLKFVTILLVAFGLSLDVSVMIKGAVKIGLSHADNSKTGIHHLDEFSSFLQDRVVGAANWPNIKRCLIDEAICSVNITRHHLYRSPMKQLKVGCCNPPAHCGFENGTDSSSSKGAGNSDPDCSAWRTANSTMCFDCETCKAGFLADLTLTSEKMLPVTITLHVVLVVIFIFGCQAFRRLRAKRNEQAYLLNKVEPARIP